MITPYYASGGITIYCGDCLEVMPELEVDFHSVVTDPPYGFEFMGKHWDKGVPSQVFWEATKRLLLPGAYQLAFGGTRTFHRLAVAIEDAGFEIRDMIAWMYGSGFPKSLDISKAIDKAAGAEREVVGIDRTKYRQDNDRNNTYAAHCGQTGHITTPSTSDAQKWDGWGTALKPALEPISVSRKPLVERTVAANVLKYGTGGINVDACRIGTDERINEPMGGPNNSYGGYAGTSTAQVTQGRFPANLIIDNSDEIAALFPETGESKAAARGGTSPNPMSWGNVRSDGEIIKGHNDSGSASRFFYCAKASQSERGNGNNHPTVKPLALIKYLVLLITPPDGILLDPFMGSGTTLRAAQDLGNKAIGIELSEEYCQIAVERLRQPSFFSLPNMATKKPEYEQVGF